MPAPSSAPPGCSTSDSPSQAGSTPSSASQTLGAGRSSKSAGPESRSSMTSEQSLALRLASIFSREGSPAAELPPPAKERAWEIQRLLSGGRWPDACASYDHASSSWRTSLLSLLFSEEERGERFLGTWPRSIMCFARTVYPLPPLAPRTSVTGSSSLLPTPRASLNESRQMKRTPSQEAGMHGKSLGAEVAAHALLPTPVGQDGKNATAPSQANRNSPPLTHVLLPTPTRGDSKQTRNKTANNGEGSPGLSGTTLTDFAYETSSGEATPEPSTDGKKSPAPLLSPSFVAWMQGMPGDWLDPNCQLSATAFTSHPQCSWARDFANSLTSSASEQSMPNNFNQPQLQAVASGCQEESTT